MSHRKNSKRRQKIEKILSVEMKTRIKKLPIDRALEVLKKLPSTKFDEAVELIIHLGIDTKQAEQQIRGTAILPFGTGKKTRVAVIAEGDQAKTAKEAGADIVGSQDLLKEIEGGQINFDKLLTSPGMMKELGKLGRVLGPKGLMPNPKDGTVTNNLVEAIENVKKGRQVNFRAEKEGGVVHLVIGRKSFSNNDLLINAKEALLTLQRMRPSSAKGSYFLSAFVKTSMSPAFEIDSTSAMTYAAAA